MDATSQSTESATIEAPVSSEATATQPLAEVSLSTEMTGKDASVPSEVLKDMGAQQSQVRPEWLPVQFWDTSKSEAQYQKLAESYSNLRGEYNRRNNDIYPEKLDDYYQAEHFDADGKFLVDDSKWVITKDDVALKIAYESAQKSGLGVKATNAFVKNFLSLMQEKGDLPDPISIEVEMQKLGKDADSLVRGIGTWLDGLKREGRIDNGMYTALFNIGSTADGIKALDFLRKMNQDINVPVMASSDIVDAEMTMEDWYQASYENNKKDGETKTQYDKRMRGILQKILNGQEKVDHSKYHIKQKRYNI